jgi:hypothetical protein
MDKEVGMAATLHTRQMEAEALRAWLAAEETRAGNHIWPLVLIGLVVVTGVVLAVLGGAASPPADPAQWAPRP